jgi:cytochrome c nitrite reductase small subunit
MQRGWLVMVSALLAGVAIGLGAFTFGYAQGYSYLTNDPAACANCHIMADHYSAWLKSSHAPAVGCNDCHTPHDNLVSKYGVKARNGFWHSFYFTTGNFPYPLRITEPNHEIVEEACRDCHAGIAEAVDHAAPSAAESVEPLACTRCHRHVGHWLR